MFWHVTHGFIFILQTELSKKILILEELTQAVSFLCRYTVTMKIFFIIKTIFTAKVYQNLNTF